MPTLIFTSANQINHARDGMDMIYSYKVAGFEKLRSIHVVGATNGWDMTSYDKHQYAQYLFAGTISYLRGYWNLHKRLPNATEEVLEGSDFESESKERIPWNRYKLNL